MKQLILRIFLSALLILGECKTGMFEYKHLAPSTMLHFQDEVSDDDVPAFDIEPELFSRRVVRSAGLTKYLWIGLVMVPILLASGCSSAFQNRGVRDQRLIKALDDSNEDVRDGAAAALGKIGPKASSAVPALIKALGDSDAYVRNGAAIALKSMGIEIEIEILNNPNKLNQLLLTKYLKYLDKDMLFDSILKADISIVKSILLKIITTLNKEEVYLLSLKARESLALLTGENLNPEELELKERYQFILQQLGTLPFSNIDPQEPPVYSDFDQFHFEYQNGTRGVLPNLISQMADTVQSDERRLKAKQLFAQLHETGILMNLVSIKGSRQSRDLGFYLNGGKNSATGEIDWSFSFMAVPEKPGEWNAKQAVGLFRLPKKITLDPLLLFLHESRIGLIFNHILYGEKLSDQDIARFNQYPGAKSFLSMLFLYDPPTWARKVTVSQRVYLFLETMLPLDPEFALQWTQFRLSENEKHPALNKSLYSYDSDKARKFTEKLIVWFSKNPTKLTSSISFYRFKEVFRLYRQNELADEKFIKIIKELEKKIAEEEKQRNKKVIKVSALLFDSASETVNRGVSFIGGERRWSANALFSNALSLGPGLNWGGLIQTSLSFVRIPELFFVFMVVGIGFGLSWALLSLTAIFFILSWSRSSEIIRGGYEAKRILTELIFPTPRLVPIKPALPSFDFSPSPLSVERAL